MIYHSRLSTRFRHRWSLWDHVMGHQQSWQKQRNQSYWICDHLYRSPISSGHSIPEILRSVCQHVVTISEDLNLNKILTNLSLLKFYINVTFMWLMYTVFPKNIRQSYINVCTNFPDVIHKTIYWGCNTNINHCIKDKL